MLCRRTENNHQPHVPSQQYFVRPRCVEGCPELVGRPLRLGLGSCPDRLYTEAGLLEPGC